MNNLINKATLITNSILILITLYMGIKQGWAMFSTKPEMLEMFNKWNFSKENIRIFGISTLLSVLLILFPRTFVLGNFLMAATILLILCLQLSVRDIKGAAIEIPFILMNLAIIYLQYPIPQKNG